MFFEKFSTAGGTSGREFVTYEVAFLAALNKTVGSWPSVEEVLEILSVNVGFAFFTIFFTVLGKLGTVFLTYVVAFLAALNNNAGACPTVDVVPAIAFENIGLPFFTKFCTVLGTPAIAFVDMGFTVFTKFCTVFGTLEMVFLTYVVAFLAVLSNNAGA